MGQTSYSAFIFAPHIRTTTMRGSAPQKKDAKKTRKRKMEEKCAKRVVRSCESEMKVHEGGESQSSLLFLLRTVLFWICSSLPHSTFAARHGKQRGRRVKAKHSSHRGRQQAVHQTEEWYIPPTTDLTAYLPRHYITLPGKKKSGR